MGAILYTTKQVKRAPVQRLALPSYFLTKVVPKSHYPHDHIHKKIKNWGDILS